MHSSTGLANFTSCTRLVNFVACALFISIMVRTRPQKTRVHTRFGEPERTYVPEQKSRMFVFTNPLESFGKKDGSTYHRKLSSRRRAMAHVCMIAPVVVRGLYVSGPTTSHSRPAHTAHVLPPLFRAGEGILRSFPPPFPFQSSPLDDRSVRI
jgi:hypothetical protein